MEANRETVEKIIALEWEMFDAVNSGAARAGCQEDYGTFAGMRAAQFDAWSREAALSYLDDLEQASDGGRNLIAEKYIHMMKTTEPAEYNALMKTIQPPSEGANALAREISNTLLEQTRELFEVYPYVSARGRPLFAELDMVGSVSVETYQLSELLTYSEKTLSLLREHINALSCGGTALARAILKNTVGFYGYPSLDAAEAAAKERIEKTDLHISFGCASCE